MPGSLAIARIGGSEIRIHVTFLLLLAWIALDGYRAGGGAVALSAVIYIVEVFACVLLHELGHVFAARFYGITTPYIVLLPFGGVARLSRMPDKPSAEIVIALAGPLVNVLIARRSGRRIRRAGRSHFGRDDPLSGRRSACPPGGGQCSARRVQPHSGLPHGWRAGAPRRADHAARCPPRDARRGAPRPGRRRPVCRPGPPRRAISS